MENGGPAPEAITDKIYENTKTIKEYFIAEDLPHVDISAIDVTSFGGPEGPFDVDVFDSASDYVKLMKSIFDFQSIQKLLSSPSFSFCFDGLHGVAGAYAKRIFVEELGAPESSLLNCTPKCMGDRERPSTGTRKGPMWSRGKSTAHTATLWEIN
ncbi:hypothetical protein L1049_007330 [Liquidambar formosana]|uniref:Phosphoglucomutase n=1 Tax=Liquidambar formosana TaxID=63359 RepID=A0AAP0RIL9_LIQFO